MELTSKGRSLFLHKAKDNTFPETVGKEENDNTFFFKANGRWTVPILSVSQRRAEINEM